MNRKLAKAIKEILYNSPFRKYFFPRFLYNFNPSQLCFLCQCLEETKDIEGDVAEIGCSDGATTLFLNKHMDAQNIQKNYYAIDTFSGFIAEDIEIEVTERGKSSEMFTGFRSNKKKWFDDTMNRHNIKRVRSIEADVNEYDLMKLKPLSFALLDVDLYRPIKKALPELFDALSPDGIIVVDDCSDSDIRFDGANQAYREFMNELGKSTEVIHNKLGIIKKDL